MPDKIIILTGEIRSGKTTKLGNWCAGRSDVYGVITPVLDGIRFFRDIHSGEQFRMEAEYGEDALTVGRFRFSKSAFNMASQILEGAIPSKGWLVIDEIGPMELRGEGFAEVLKRIIEERKGGVVIVVRSALLDKVITVFEMKQLNPVIIDPDANFPD